MEYKEKFELTLKALVELRERQKHYMSVRNLETIPLINKELIGLKVKEAADEADRIIELVRDDA